MGGLADYRAAKRAQAIAAEIEERKRWRELARVKLRESIEGEIAAQHVLDEWRRKKSDAAGIIVEVGEQIDKLLEQLHALIPRQENRPDH